MPNNCKTVTQKDQEIQVDQKGLGSPAALNILGYKYNSGHVIYNMQELAQFPFIVIWNSRSNVGQGHSCWNSSKVQIVCKSVQEIISYHANEILHFDLKK